ncbi:hypothetical protein ACFC8N_39430 [Streptomyces sp. NPDC055966]|uniref:hypothetical protein n=1 Tax=Streptomyces sp. NPDC055966 TaxID=3345669 RepID=UPI0035D63BA6
MGGHPHGHGCGREEDRRCAELLLVPPASRPNSAAESFFRGREPFVHEEDRAAGPAEGLVLDGVRVVEEVALGPVRGVPGPVGEDQFVVGLTVEEQEAVRRAVRVPGREGARLETGQPDNPFAEVPVESDVEEQPEPLARSRLLPPTDPTRRRPEFPAASRSVRGPGRSRPRASHRIDFKYAMAMDLDDPGFQHSVPADFRGRLAEDDRADRLLDLALARLKKAGLVRERTTQRTDSTHVLAAVRDLTRLELITEAVRAALAEVAGTSPHLLDELADEDWGLGYGRPVRLG